MGDTCLGYAELCRMKKHYWFITQNTGVLTEDNTCHFWGISSSETSKNLYRAFNLMEEKDGVPFCTFALVMDSIIGFNFPRIRLNFTKHFFGLHEAETISTKQLKDMYDQTRNCASADC